MLATTRAVTEAGISWGREEVSEPDLSDPWDRPEHDRGPAPLPPLVKLPPLLKVALPLRLDCTSSSCGDARCEKQGASPA